MNFSPARPDTDQVRILKGLMYFRVLFVFLLLGSTIIFGIGKSPSSDTLPFFIAIGLCSGILFLSICYFIIYHFIKNAVPFVYIQLGIDTCIITGIIFITGSYASVFTFMYLVVIICSSMLLFRPGSIVTATLCVLQYSALIILEYNDILLPFEGVSDLPAAYVKGTLVVYRVTAVSVACYAVAFLTSLLTEQEKRTKTELLSLEEHVKRVEKAAAVGEMAAGLAHEIKNPLASLSGSIQLMQEELEYHPQHEKLMQIVLREADRLSNLVTDFLLFARPRVAKIETIRLDNAMNEAVALFEKDIASRRNIAVTTRFSEDLWVEMDPKHLHQVLWNLFLNAADAIGQDGKIDVALYPLKRTHAAIEISDDGCGIPEAALQTIFDPFFTTRPSGTGLGLSIVQRILVSYNCLLDVNSKVNQGTTFILKLEQAVPQQSPAN
jgi:two-component system sensor histidine kinase HydH